MKILFKWQGSDKGEEGKRDCKCVLEKIYKKKDMNSIHM